jgi:hypothetical protein
VRAIDGKRTAKEAAATLAQRRAAASERASRAIDVLRTIADSRRHQAAVDALERMILRGRNLGFGSIAEMLEPQPWVFDPVGRVIGHALVADAAVLNQAIDADRLDAMPLPEALELSWADIDARTAWGELYAASLRALADHADGATRAAEDAEALRRLLEPEKQSDV